MWKRIGVLAVASVALWATCVSAVWWYLQRMLAEDVRAGAPTNADSIGLPLISFAILLAIVMLLANVGITLFLLRRRA